MRRIHLDTDLGDDPDDVSALALLLGAPDVEVVGITTSIDPGGKRAGYVDAVLAMAGRTDIPVAAGAAVSMTTLERPGAFPDEALYWPEPVAPRPGRPGAALDLLAQSAAAGATVVTIGPFTNLALLEVLRPGTLAASDLVVMGGWTEAPPVGFPKWERDYDWNVECDTVAAQIVREHADALVVSLWSTVQVHLCRSQVERLRAAGPLGDLIARQGEAHAEEYDVAAMAAAHHRLPVDLLNFQHDALACAVAMGWDGVEIRDRAVVGVDAEAFDELWLTAVERASSGIARS